MNTTTTTNATTTTITMANDDYDKMQTALRHYISAVSTSGMLGIRRFCAAHNLEESHEAMKALLAGIEANNS